MLNILHYGQRILIKKDLIKYIKLENQNIVFYNNVIDKKEILLLNYKNQKEADLHFYLFQKFFF